MVIFTATIGSISGGDIMGFKDLPGSSKNKNKKATEFAKELTPNTKKESTDKSKNK